MSDSVRDWNQGKVLVNSTIIEVGDIKGHKRGDMRGSHVASAFLFAGGHMNVLAFVTFILFLAFLVEGMVEYLVGALLFDHIPALQPWRWPRQDRQKNQIIP